MLLPLFATLQAAQVPAIHLSTSQFTAEYGYLRSLEEAGERSSDPNLQGSIDALAKLEKSFPDQIKTRSGAVIKAIEGSHGNVDALYWRTLDALTFSAGSTERLSSIPDLMPLVGGQLDSTKAFGTIAQAMKGFAPTFAKNVWPDMEREAQARISEFMAAPEAKRKAALEFIIKNAGLTNPPTSVDIQVIPRMAGKEGMTVRTPGGTLIIIGSGKYERDDFVEVVLHESTHVLDTSAGADSLFGKLRKALTAKGRPAFEIEQVPHVCMFVLAAMAVRQEIAPNHKDVGETFGAYSRGLEPLRKIVQPELEALAKGRSVDETVSAIMAKFG